jgi:hypothetical protein
MALLDGWSQMVTHPPTKGHLGQIIKKAIWIQYEKVIELGTDSEDARKLAGLAERSR